MKGEAWLNLTPITALIAALAFPFIYGIYDLIKRKTWNLLSIIGLVSILLTGGIGLLTLPTQWIAIKEAAIPFVIGLVVLGSLKTRYPLIKTFLLNEQFMAIHKIETALSSESSKKALNTLLSIGTLWLSVSFFISSALNFFLARWIVVSEAGTQAFTEELGKMTLWSYPVILLPSMIMLIGIFWWILKRISQLTGLPIEELFIDPKKQ
jgi:hypothetical protein